MQHLQPDTTLQGGKYKIVRFISNGGFGNTYEALDVNLDKRVAIKEFFVKDFCTRESDTTIVTVSATTKKPLIEHLKKKFIEEARAIAKMEHENIVKVQALFEENSTAYYVMDYIDGESLSDLLNRRGSLSEKEALPIILKVADALGYMHKQNCFHLDVKPANIMLRNDGKVLLIDFGSSKQYAEVDGENTTTLAPCYTPGYAPSEQMNPKPTAFTAATDVYALGATLYKMLTGQTPPSAINLQNEEESLSALPGDVSSGARKAVEGAMRPSRKNRLQSVNEFVSLLPSTEVEGPTLLGSKRYIWGCLIAIPLIALALILIISKNKQDSPANASEVPVENGTATVASASGNDEAKKEETVSGKEKAGDGGTSANTAKVEKQQPTLPKTANISNGGTSTRVQKKEAARSSITFPFGTYTGPDDGAGNGNRGTISVTSYYTLSCNGAELNLEPGDEIVNTQIRSGKLVSGKWIHNGKGTVFSR